MFGIGMTELLVILVVALLVVGPKRLPELARSLGRAMGEFRRASTDFRQQLAESAEPPPEAESPPEPRPGSAEPEPPGEAPSAAKPAHPDGPSRG